MLHKLKQMLHFTSLGLKKKLNTVCIQQQQSISSLEFGPGFLKGQGEAARTSTCGTQGAEAGLLPS